MQRKALVIGVDQYKGEIIAPKFALKDAESIGLLLQTVCQFDQVQVLLNGIDPTTNKSYNPQELEDLIFQLFHPKDTDTDTVVFYFSGDGAGILGAEGSENQRGDLLLADFPDPFAAPSSASKAASEHQWKSRSINLNWLYQQLESSPVKQQIVWLDSDFSYSFIQLFLESDTHSTHDRCLIASTVQYAEENSGQGALTAALLQCLNPVKQIKNLINSYDLTDTLVKTFNWSDKLVKNIGNPILLTGRNVRAQKLWNDLAEGDDLLNIKNEVDALADMLLLRDLQPPLAVGVLGGWGSGKSFIMSLMQQRMVKIRSSSLTEGQAYEDENKTENGVKKFYPYVGHIYQIKFDAWTYAQSDLWVSLMQTIFFELDRQITLEQELRAFFEKNGIDPCEENSTYSEVWSALYQVSDEERRYFLQKVLNIEDLEELKNIATAQDRLATAAKLLWGKRVAIKTRNSQILWEKQQQLQTLEDDLQKAQENLNLAKDNLQQVKEQTTEAVLAEKMPRNSLEQVIRETLGISGIILRQRLGEEEFQKFQQEVIQQLPEDINLDELGQLSLAIKGAIANILEDNGRNFKFSQTTIRQWGSKNLSFIIGFCCLALLSIVLPVWIASVKPDAIIPQLVAFISPLLPAITLAQKLWRSGQKFYNQTQIVIQEYGKEVQANSQQVVEQEVQRVTQEQQERITQLERQVANLELEKQQIQEEIQEVLPENRSTALKSFVDTRLQQYDKRLGLMYQVKNDLLDLSNRLLPASDKTLSNQEYQQKLDDLKVVFPRGPARVVVFVDDLDRCPPDRVVRVLEAVQLLVKTPLFIAVLAIDERYVTRALEKHYEGILIRKGRPSGTDYLEKIIQIPYRVRPITRSALFNYLDKQMEVERQPEEDMVKSNSTSTGGSPEQTTVVPGQKYDRQLLPSARTASTTHLTLNTLKFTEAEFEILLQCCQQIELSPRMIKRLINIYKIFKISEFHSNKVGQKSNKQTRAILSMLSLSACYPDLIREVFENLEIKFEDFQILKASQDKAAIAESEAELNNKKLLDLDFFPSASLEIEDAYLQREYKRLNIDATALLRDITLADFNLEIFNLVRSFCFFGDIGYSPEDFQQKHTRKIRNERYIHQKSQTQKSDRRGYNQDSSE